MTIGNDKAGAGARSPFAIPTEGWLAVLRRTWEETGKDNIGLIAAGIAFYAFAAIVPLLGAVVLSYGLFAEPETVRSNVEHVFAAVPREAATIITEQLVTVVETSKGKQGLGLIIAIALAFYGATKGASAIVTALNVAYGETERRGFFRVNLLYFALVAGGVFLIFLAIASTTLLGFLESLVPRASDVLLTLIRVAGYALLGAFVVTAAAILYRFGPDRRKPSWVWLSPGSLAATVLWLVGTAGFGVYVSNFGNYGATYGSLSAVIVMLTWLWLSAFVFLLGAELNAELERQVEGEGAEAQPSTSPLSDSPHGRTPDPSGDDRRARAPDKFGTRAPPTNGPAWVEGALCAVGLLLLRNGKPGKAAVAIVGAVAAYKIGRGASTRGSNGLKLSAQVTSNEPERSHLSPTKEHPMADRDNDISVLNSLIATTLDSVDGYTEAAGDIENPRYGSVFSDRARERREVVSDLQAEVRRLGGDPEDDGTVLAGAHRMFLDLKAKVTGQDDKAIIDEVERGEDHIKAKFDDALAKEDLSPEVRAAIAKANQSVQEGHDQMRDLKHSMER